MSKQTAVEWLVEQCPRIETIVAYSILQQAKEMEKQQIIDAWDNGYDRGYGYTDAKFDSAEQYYNETFNK
jgi:hypothetical protein